MALLRGWRVCVPPHEMSIRRAQVISTDKAKIFWQCLAVQRIEDDHLIDLWYSFHEQ